MQQRYNIINQILYVIFSFEMKNFLIISSYFVKETFSLNTCMKKDIAFNTCLNIQIGLM